VPARDEAGVIERLLDALDLLDYPASRLFTVVVDDGSLDETRALVAEWARARPRTLLVELRAAAGKSRALNEGIAAAPPSELIGVCDADLRPLPDCFRRLAEPFTADEIGATVGYLRPVNGSFSATSRYAAVETWVHQLVTSAGKDRLGLNPPSLGLCVYRRAALEDIGWFSVAHADDTASTIELTRAGWSTRFVPDAVADNLVVSRPADYWRQHVRWARHLLGGGRAPSRRARQPRAQRLENVLFAVGYVDRLFVLAAVGLAAAHALTFWVPLAYLALPALEVLVALLKARTWRELPAYFFATTVLFPLDLLASLAAVAVWPLPRGRSGWRPRRNVAAARRVAHDAPGD
jgi:glycosyltransferase involved in cell wall biosynthesis